MYAKFNVIEHQFVRGVEESTILIAGRNSGEVVKGGYIGNSTAKGAINNANTRNWKL